MGNSTWYYQMPNATDSADFLNYFSWANNVSGGIFIPALYFGIYIIFFIIGTFMSKPSVALVSSSFLCGIMSIILSTLGLLSPTYMYLTIFLFAVGIFWLSLENRR